MKLCDFGMSKFKYENTFRFTRLSSIEFDQDANYKKYNDCSKMKKLLNTENADFNV